VVTERGYFAREDQDRTPIFPRLYLKEPMSKSEIEATARVCLEAVVQYLDHTTRKHNCPGYDCSICSLHAERYGEALNAIIESLNALPLFTTQVIK
jgi:hypothetical protein